MRVSRVRLRTVAWLSALLAGAAPASAATEWQIRPFVGLTFGGGTTLVDLESASGSPNVVFGFNGGLLGEVTGVELDFGHSPGFFDAGRQFLVSKSRVTTLTGNVIVGLPRTATEYSLRPYFVGGLGMMHARTFDASSVLQLNITRPAMNVGGGLSGALSDLTALSWEVRHFRSLGGEINPQGLSFGPEKLSFWRATMAVVVRY